MSNKEWFNLLRQAGFDGVILWWNDEFGDTNFHSNPIMARDAGLFVENIHASFDKVSNLWLDNLDGNAQLDYFLGLIDDCAKYQIPAMVMHLTCGINPPPYNELGLDRVKLLVEKAEKNEVNLAFENLSTTKHLEYVLNRIDSPRAGFCYDSGHHHCWTPKGDFLAQYGSRLMSLHLHDNDGTDDHHLLPLDGNIDWPATMSKIKKTGYTGPIAMEVVNTGYKDLPPEEFLRLLYERAKKLEVLMQ